MLDPEKLEKSQYLLYAWRRQESEKEIKIGKSTAGRLYGRIITAQTDNPYPIVFLGIQLVDAENEYEMKRFENSVLEDFDKIREEGEWVLKNEEVDSWIRDKCIPISFEAFKSFHRDKTRELRKKPMFVEREREKTRERRAKEREAKAKGTPQETKTEKVRQARKTSTTGMFKPRSK